METPANWALADGTVATTAPEETPDLLGRLNVTRFSTATGGIIGRLTKESVSVDGVAMTRYAVEYSKGGLFLSFAEVGVWRW